MFNYKMDKIYDTKGLRDHRPQGRPRPHHPDIRAPQQIHQGRPQGVCSDARC